MKHLLGIFHVPNLIFPNQLITWQIPAEPAIRIQYIMWSSLFMGGGEANS